MALQHHAELHGCGQMAQRCGFSPVACGRAGSMLRSRLKRSRLILGGNHAGCRRTLDDAQGLLASAADLDPDLFSLLPRSHQCRLRRADHEQGSGPRCRHLRHGGRRLLLGLFPARSAEQLDPGKSRRPDLDRAYHGELGPTVRRHRIRRRAVELRDHALPARPRRGGTVSRHDPVLHILVPGLAPRQDRFGIHGGAASGSGGGSPPRCSA
jgi:hypothetical protein